MSECFLGYANVAILHILIPKVACTGRFKLMTSYSGKIFSFNINIFRLKCFLFEIFFLHLMP
ncbi:MAG: hypothetical protein RIS29_3104 [Bacteroidota bacterium]|jgi:hypothetical protein